VVIVVGVLQVRVQRWVDRRVNRSRYVYGRALAQASAALAQTRSLDAIAGTVRATLVEAMRLSRAYFAVWTDRGHSELRCIALGGLGEQRAPLPARLGLADFAPIARAVESRALVSTHDSDAVAAQSLTSIELTGDGRGEADFWGHHGIEAIVPLTFGPEKQVVGLLLIGPRDDDRPLDSEDHGLLATLAHQLATAVQNAEAFEEIRRLNEGLEQQVAERTRELSHALESLKGAQGQLVETEKQATIGRLAAGIVHEINTPLGTLRSSVDTIDRALRRCQPLVATAEGEHVGRALEVGSRSAQVLRTSSDRLQRVVESLKRFVSVDESEERALNVQASIEDAVALLGPTLGERIEIVRDYPDAVPPVRCNPARINQVFVNLLENAAQAIDERGRIEIAVVAGDGRLEISFSDDGRGIPAVQQQRLFAFDLATKRDGRVGLRLGLPSSKRAVEAIGGTLELRSAEGQGTTVRLNLPTILPGSPR
jgi:signal transduction histidine kinase